MSGDPFGGQLDAQELVGRTVRGKDGHVGDVGLVAGAGLAELPQAQPYRHRSSTTTRTCASIRSLGTSAGQISETGVGADVPMPLAADPGGPATDRPVMRASRRVVASSAVRHLTA